MLNKKQSQYPPHNKQKNLSKYFLNFSLKSHNITSNTLSITWDTLSIQFSYSVLSNSLQPHGQQHPDHHQLTELVQAHIHRVGDSIQKSHPLSSPSPPALNLSQHQGLFKWISSSHQVAKVLEFQLQHQSFQWIFRTDFL